MKKLAVIATLLTGMISLSAQEWKGPFRHLDLSVSAGTLGIGLDVNVPVTKWMDMRVGGTFMPHINVDANFEVNTGKIENGQFVRTGKFAEMADIFKDFSGYDVRDNVTMSGHLMGSNFSFLLDFKPVKNWHITAGFYWGSSQFAEAQNSLSDAVTLLGVGMYNHMYDNICGTNLPSSLSGDIYQRMIESRDSYGDKPWMTIGDTDLHIDPMMTDEEVRDYCNKVTTALVNDMFNNSMTVEDMDQMLGRLDRMKRNGRVGVYMGNYKHSTYEYDASGNIKKDENGNPVYKRDAAGNEMREGYPYVMIPDTDGTARVDVKTNSFKPYLGIGYGREIGGKKVKGLKLSVDAGLLFWGGSPDIIVHDGTNLKTDIDNLQGRVGSYVEDFSTLKVYPMLTLRLSKSIF